MKLVFLFAVGVFLTAPVFAARVGHVEMDETPVHTQPTAMSDVITKLAKGSTLAVSNLPTAGFYKVKLSDGTLGWVLGEALRLEQAPDMMEVETQASALQEKSDKSKRETVITDSAAELRIFGGGAFFQMKDAAQVAGFEDSTVGYYFGGDFHIPISTEWSIAFRVDHIRKVSTVQSPSANDVFQFSASSTPVMGGLVWERFLESDLSVFFSGYAGMAYNTQFASVALSRDEPNETVYESSAVTGLLSGGFQWYLTPSFGLTSELGYRVLTTSESVPVVAGNGSEVFRSGSQYAAISISMNGLFAGAGIVFRF